MFVVIAYDIPDDKRRTKVMKLLQGYGEHVQESVFECDLESGIFRQMTQRLNKLLEPNEDNVCFYYLSQADVGRIERHGVRRVEQAVSYCKIV
ncbi:MAG: CRISPR-associated endonuclease Cas2 [Anaerolineae bacterium]|nr:CRISPR-associated endonuclease Cas2 [Anaerolineae bacterium]